MFLTGTPIQNSLGELFTLLQLLDPDQFASRAEFVDKYSHINKTGGTKDIESLHSTLQPYLFRRMKNDVEKDLPPREETLISVEMTSQQKQSDTQIGR